MKSYVFLALAAATSLALPSAVYAQSTVHAQTSHHKAAAPGPRLVEIRMDNDFKPKSRTEYGRLQGYDPVVTVVHRGDRIRFVNVDDVQHTATGYAFGAGQIPANYKFQGDPSTTHGTVINRSEWSTGNVAAHSRSKVFQTSATGTFYFADAYHPTQMRGAIVVK